jgi:hypothetical protein
LAEEEARLDSIGRVCANTLRAGVPNSPHKAGRNQCLVQIASIDLPLDTEIGQVKSRTLRNFPIPVNPAVVDDERNGWCEKPGKAQLMRLSMTSPLSAG